MLRRALTVLALLLIAAAALLAATGPSETHAAARGFPSDSSPTSPATVTSVPTSSVTEPTINEFLPEDRALGDCISAVPKPGCGSEARGGWHQWLVLAAILTGLGVIGWRIRAGMRRGRAEPDLTESGRA